MRRRITVALATSALLAAMAPAGATLAQDGAWTVVVDGVDAPRGLEFGADGTLYAAIAGSGGDECMDVPNPEGGEPMQACMGATSAVWAIDVATGTATPVVDGLPSAFLTSEGVLGASDVAVSDGGDMYYLTADGNVPDAAERAEGDIGGILWKAGADGMGEQVADLVAFEASDNPDGGLLDSNPNGVVVGPDGSILVADAGGNALVSVAADGTVSTIATFPDTMAEMPAMPEGAEGTESSEAAQGAEGAEGGEAGEPQMIPRQAVPTHVTIGPDDAAYVTFLTGFPFTPGAAWVARVADGETTVYADGFTNVIGSAFASDGTLYVLEISHNGLLSGDPTGGLWSVPPGGGEATLVTTDGLTAPGGIAINADDEIFVSNGSAFPGSGAIVKLNQ